MSQRKSSAREPFPAHPPPTTGEDTCPPCSGTGYVLIDSRYVPTTGILTEIRGTCPGCKGLGERSAFRYGRSA